MNNEYRQADCQGAVYMDLDAALKCALADCDFGKGDIKLPDGATVIRGKVVSLSIRIDRCGAGMLQGKVVYSEQNRFSRSSNGDYYYDFHCVVDGVETMERHLAPNEYIACLNRIVNNSGMTAWNALPHNLNSSPAFFSPFNTLTPNNNMSLCIEKEDGENMEFQFSSEDAGNAGGGKVLSAIFGIIKACKAEKSIRYDRYCRNCGSKRLDGAKFCADCGTPFE